MIAGEALRKALSKMDEEKKSEWDTILNEGLGPRILGAENSRGNQHDRLGYKGKRGS